MTAICSLLMVWLASRSGALSMRTRLGAAASRRNVGARKPAVWEAAVLLPCGLAAGVEEGHDREHASVVVGAGRQVQLRHHALDVLFDRALADPEVVGDADVRSALRHQAKNVAFARGQVGKRVAPAPSPHQLLDQRRIDHATALDDPLDGVDELVAVADAILEQVADAVTVPEQLA